MKLSKQERIAVLVIAVLIILGVGIFMFIVPKWEQVSNTQKSLDGKKAEYQTVLDTAAKKDGLKDEVIAAYEAGRDTADMFFEEMVPYELDNETRAFIKYCQDKGVNMVVDSLNVSNPAVSTLAVSFFEDGTEINYDLKQYATQGQSQSEEDLEAAARRQILMTQLAGSQQVAASTVSFTINVLEDQEYLDFVDLVNEYIKEENGKEIRKAVMIDGLSMTYSDVTEKYEKLAAEMQVDIDKKANEEFKKNGGTVESEEKTEDPSEDDDEDEKTSIGDELKSYGITLTFYSIERMQDPTDQLDAQDEVA